MSVKKGFTYMGKVEEFPKHRKIEREIDGKPVFILNRGEKWFAFETRCPHQRRTLIDARAKDNVLECIYHSMAFNMETGEIVDNAGYIGAIPLVVYKVELDDEGGVWAG